MLGLGLLDATELNEVKDEVRQETLLATQLARVQEHLTVAEAASHWTETLHEELDQLQAFAPSEPVLTEIHAVIDASLGGLVQSSSSDFDAALAYRESLLFEHSDQARAAYVDRLDGAWQRLGAAELNEQWLADAGRVAAWTGAVYPPSSQLVAAREAAAEALAERIVDELLPGETALAERVWALIDPMVFDADIREVAGTGVDLAHEREVVEAARAAAAQRQRELTASLEELVGGSCLRVDLDQVARWFTALDGADRSHQTHLERHATKRLNGCVNRLAALEPAQAQRFAQRLQTIFGHAVTAPGGIDPCAAHYLVERTQPGGRPGTCADRLSRQQLGPELVVLPGNERKQAFAISRYEISWQDLEQFCLATTQCEPQRTQATFPVAGLPITTVEAYAQWLSERTGYRYRLPTLAEWQLASAGQPDPNRNCRVDVGGVRRGSSAVGVASGSANDHGLYNVLGNVREIVVDDGTYAAAGGGFRDPIDRCRANSAQPLEEVVDLATGFRLVREIS